MFDMKARALRRDRAARTGGDLFLLERAFEDCLDRLDIIGRRFDRAMLLGCPSPDWKTRLSSITDAVDVVDPGTVFAARSGGRQLIEDLGGLPATTYDLVLAIGTLDTVNGLQVALRGLFEAMKPGGLLIGAMSGGETLPLLRHLMAAADRTSGNAVPRVHPRIEAAMFAPLLEQAGFVRPVVDLDRVRVEYGSFDRLVADLRAMAATNILAARSRTPITRTALAAARAGFNAAKKGAKAQETFEIVHFAAWRPDPEATTSPRN